MPTSALRATAPVPAAAPSPPDPTPAPPWLDALALGLLPATEAAVLAAAEWIGRGDKNATDGAAVRAMRAALAGLPADGTVVIGEGEKDRAPMLHNGERFGAGTGPRVDLAVDPVDGTTLTSNGAPGAVAVLAVAPHGALSVPTDVHYMDKLVCGPAGIGVVDLDRTPEDNVRALAAATGRDPREITVAVLDRPRHTGLVARLRAAGARVHVFPDGDVVAGLLAMAAPGATPGGPGTAAGTDLFLGVGGTPEGVVAACAAAALGAVFQGRLAPRDEGERSSVARLGDRGRRVLGIDDLVAGGHAAVVTTGLTDGALLPGVEAVGPGRWRTTSLVLSSSGAGPRRVVTDHGR